MESLKREIDMGYPPIDFNHLMRSQLIRALLIIAPSACKELLEFLLETIYLKEPERFSAIFLMGDDAYELADLCAQIITEKGLPMNLISEIAKKEEMQDIRSHEIERILSLIDNLKNGGAVGPQEISDYSEIPLLKVNRIIDELLIDGTIYKSEPYGYKKLW